MKKLSKETEALRQAILANGADFTGDDAGLALLDSGMRAHDTELECLSIIHRDGLVVKGDRGQTKAHPLCAVARDARSQFFTAMRLLGLLEMVEDKSVGRPTSYESWKKAGVSR